MDENKNAWKTQFLSFTNFYTFLHFKKRHLVVFNYDIREAAIKSSFYVRMTASYLSEGAIGMCQMSKTGIFKTLQQSKFI